MTSDHYEDDYGYEQDDDDDDEHDYEHEHDEDDEGGRLQGIRRERRS